tara:strand:- start:659 stop:841 length:183 start_codon:yes stop_codon:yes gene_type:complete
MREATCPSTESGNTVSDCPSNTSVTACQKKMRKERGKGKAKEVRDEEKRERDREERKDVQ